LFNPYGLDNPTMEAIVQNLAKIRKVEQAILYGSRAKGNYKPGSDVDLTLKGDHLTLRDIYQLEELLDDLFLPYQFDISIYEQISHPDLLAHIERVGVVIYQKATL